MCSESLYGTSVKGSNDSVAMECAKDLNCKAFRYSSKHRIGFFCNDTDVWGTVEELKDWKLCSFGSS